MARFNCNGVGIVNSITEAPPPPIEIVAAADDKAGYSLTNAANTELDVTLVSGQELTLVNNGGGGYTDGTTTNSTAFTEVVNEQTGQGSQTLPNLGTLTITTTVGNVVRLLAVLLVTTLVVTPSQVTRSPLTVVMLTTLPV